MAAERKPRTKATAKETPEPLMPVAGHLADPDAKQFDRLVYERVRLGILSVLAVNDALSFTELRDLLGTSDGNLSVHARKLEEAGYVGCKKTFTGRTPQTTYRLTARGRKALDRYLKYMETLIHAVGRGSEDA